MIHRRTFFKICLASGLFLGGAYTVSKSLHFEKHPDFVFFDSEDVLNLMNFSRSILLGTSIPDSELLEVVKGVETAVMGLPKVTRKEIKELMLLFKWRPLRLAMGRVAPWSEATPDEVEELLLKLKFHRFNLMRTAYGALCELINASYYANPKNWEAIGYPGPPELSL